jgi:hypothetical protein
VSTKSMAGGILSRFAMTAVAATIASSKTSTWIVAIIGVPSRKSLVTVRSPVRIYAKRAALTSAANSDAAKHPDSEFKI